MSRFKMLSHGHKGLRGYGENIFWGIGITNFDSITHKKKFKKNFYDFEIIFLE